MWSAIIASNRLRGKAIEIVNSDSISVALADNVPTVLTLSFTPNPANKLYIFTNSAQVRTIEVSGFTNIYTVTGANPQRGWVANHLTNQITVTSTNGTSTTRINIVEIANSTGYTYGGTDRQTTVTSINSPSLDTVKNSLLLIPAYTAQAFVGVDNGFTVITETPAASAKGLVASRYYTTVETNQFTTVTQSTSGTMRATSLLIT
jgi:hypothetical protein